MFYMTRIGLFSVLKNHKFEEHETAELLQNLSFGCMLFQFEILPYCGAYKVRLRRNSRHNIFREALKVELVGKSLEVESVMCGNNL